MQNANLSTMTVELTFSSEQVTQLDEVVRVRQLVPTEAIQLAVAEWLEKQYKLIQARRDAKIRARARGWSTAARRGAKS